MRDLSHFQFDTNPLWDDIQKRLQDMIEVETSEALTQEVSPEVRGHQCGRAEALADFKHSLIETWEQANAR
tara:strand:- start:435 stop:647 length:213 start_codon:yes stop_codon:yes gene_type:complete